MIRDDDSRCLMAISDMRQRGAWTECADVLRLLDNLEIRIKEATAMRDTLEKIREDAECEINIDRDARASLGKKYDHNSFASGCASHARDVLEILKGEESA